MHTPLISKQPERLEHSFKRREATRKLAIENLEGVSQLTRVILLCLFLENGYGWSNETCERRKGERHCAFTYWSQNCLPASIRKEIVRTKVYLRRRFGKGRRTSLYRCRIRKLVPLIHRIGTSSVTQNGGNVAFIDKTGDMHCDWTCETWFGGRVQHRIKMSFLFCISSSHKSWTWNTFYS